MTWDRLTWDRGVRDPAGLVRIVPDRAGRTWTVLRREESDRTDLVRIVPDPADQHPAASDHPAQNHPAGNHSARDHAGRDHLVRDRPGRDQPGRDRPGVGVVGWDSTGLGWFARWRAGRGLPDGG